MSQCHTGEAEQLLIYPDEFEEEPFLRVMNPPRNLRLTWTEFGDCQALGHVATGKKNWEN